MKGKEKVVSGAVTFFKEFGFMSRCRLEECARKVVVTTERKGMENNKGNGKRIHWEKGRNDGGDM